MKPRGIRIKVFLQNYAEKKGVKYIGFTGSVSYNLQITATFFFNFVLLPRDVSLRKSVP